MICPETIRCVRQVPIPLFPVPAATKLRRPSVRASVPHCSTLVCRHTNTCLRTAFHPPQHAKQSTLLSCTGTIPHPNSGSFFSGRITVTSCFVYPVHGWHLSKDWPTFVLLGFCAHTDQVSFVFQRRVSIDTNTLTRQACKLRALTWFDGYSYIV